jgi:DNA-binding MarR family transcriptional regulator
MELSNLLKVDKATTTKAVQKLMKEDYILRERNHKDSRGWCLFPSDRAKDIYEYIIQEENKNIELCLTGLNSEERSTICKLLGKMSENISSEWHELKNYSAGNK